MKLKFLCTTCLLLCFSIANAHIVQLTRAQISNSSKNTRVMFSLTGPTRFHAFILKKPDRLVIDFRNTTLAASLNNLHFYKTNITAIKSGQHADHTLRIVFQLKKSVHADEHLLHPHGRFGYRLVINLVNSKTAVAIHAPQQEQLVPEKIFEPAENIQAPTHPTHLREAVVVIDPGHGGRDPGATGTRGTHEKMVVLAIGKDLYAMLKKQPGIKPEMTRHGDYFVTLRNRLRVARRDHADLFIAIHADAYINHYSRGASIFALSQRGATSEAARWLAQKENYSELGGVDLEDKSYLLRSVLLDLSQTATIRDSIKCGNDVLRQMRMVAHLHRGFVEQAPFVVLKSPDIPSLLIETGFLSNAREELLLRDKNYQHRIAHALMV
ncbi:MAG: N-acetylmuramoyl-L-alanine amidase, partial [Gammaproteobacteria bacterium]|nr:N-acetylmuramoyl-L-alanine amidase [Gammaproteobacteria bacterium]